MNPPNVIGTALPSPCVIVQKGHLSEKSLRALRKAGYQVVEADDISKVQHFYPDNFKVASDRAKVLAFDYHCGGGGAHVVTQDTLRENYVRFLKQQKAF